MTHAEIVNALLSTMYAGPFQVFIPGVGQLGGRRAPGPPSAERLATLVDSVGRMEAAGVAWDSDAIDLIAAGDQDEAQETYGDVDGYAELNKVLGDLFEEQ